MATERRYRHAGVVLVRASTDPGGLEPPDELDLTNDNSVVQIGRAWLAHLWQRAEVQAALRVASPALCQQVDAVLGSDPVEARRFRRLLISIASYVLRWQHRSTPFGLFAGVATSSIGATPSVAFGPEHRAVLRADAEWLSSVIDRLEQDHSLLWRLPVTVNTAGCVRGDRFVMPMQPDAAALNRGTSLELSVRLTRALRVALACAIRPIRLDELAAELTAKFPTVPTEKIHALLVDLVQRRILVTGLRPPMTCVDGLDHVLDQLELASGAELPSVADLLKKLTLVRDDLAHPPSVEAVAERMRSLGDTTGHVLAVDVAMNCQVTLPQAVLHEAEVAASTLLRLTPHPFGTPAWKDFHIRFRDRYGAGAAVPVRDVVADSGLGFPAGFLDAPRGHAVRALSERDAFLLALIQETTTEGRDEIELTESIIRTLTVGDHSEMHPPSRVELAFELHTASLDALAHGQFRLWVTGAPRPESSMAGRFAHLLTSADQQRLAASFKVPGDTAVLAQLSFPPRRERNENISRVPQMLPDMISVSEHRPIEPGRIELDDLAVTADATQLHLVQVSTGNRVQPRVLHALEASVQTPPLVRFLAEVGSARCGVYGRFDFGAARTLPFLPRIRYGRVVLSPARWLLDVADLREAPTWDVGLRGWRERWRVPSNVLLCQGELRLPLDLDKQLHRQLLRIRLDHARRVELREASEQSDHAWAGRPCEVLVSLTRTQPSAERPKTAPITIARNDALLPGRSSVLYAQLFGHPIRFSEILTEHLPRLIDAIAGDVRGWWFRREHDTTRPDSDHHLALYLRLIRPESYGIAATQLAEWAAALRASGLLAHLNLATYQPQYGRYGHGQAMAAAEQVFAADSAAALAQISMASVPDQALAAASMVDLSIGLTDCTQDGCQRLVDLLPHEHGEVDRPLRDTALTLADPSDDHIALRTHSGGNDVVAAWHARRAALYAYRGTCDPTTVLRSLLHDHHVRAVGVAPERERVTNRLARAAAQRLLHGGHR